MAFRRTCIGCTLRGAPETPANNSHGVCTACASGPIHVPCDRVRLCSETIGTWSKASPLDAFQQWDTGKGAVVAARKFYLSPTPDGNVALVFRSDADATAADINARYPGESEGALAPRFTALVRREALERIARQLHFGDHLILAKGEQVSGGRENSANLADACEAVIAALFLDGGYAAAAKFINHYWAAPMAEDISPPRDAKSALQEWCQAHHGMLPVYQIVNRQGPAHAPSFDIEVRVADVPAAAATGGSKQAAEQAAAQLLLQRLMADRNNENG